MVSRSAAKAPYSLQTRLVLAFGTLLILFLGLTGLVLDQAFKGSVAAAIQERLQLQIYALLGVAEPDGEGFFVPDLEDARFRQIDSGLYGLILDDAGNELWRSASALNLQLEAAPVTEYAPAPGETQFGSYEAPALGTLSYAVYGIIWASQDERYRFVVLESNAPSAAEIREFQSSLWFWLGGMAVLLSLLQYLLLRWGLAPLKALAGDIARVEAGERERLSEQYPAEIRPLSRNMNLLIHSERQRQQRYKSTLGDLAHSLKTPLAVIDGAVQDQAGAVPYEQDAGLGVISEQVLRMNQIITWQLKRAAQTGQHALLAKPVSLSRMLNRLCDALEKVYRERDLRVQRELDPQALFYGEESDFMEVLGNVLDNAFKYTRTRVLVRSGQDEKGIWVSIEDDGPGIAEAYQHWVLQRGARADTVRTGQGIGLAVAVEIVSNYGGELDIGRGELGGACIRLRVPQPGRRH